MRRDHRPYPLKRAQARLEAAYIQHFVAPHLDALGANPMIMKPWYLKVHGKGISIGAQPHIVTDRARPVALTTWDHPKGHGLIAIGDYCLLCPGVRIDSATKVQVGANSMLAANAYITDADWHNQYDRSEPVGNTAAVVLEENTWIGDSAIVCKGVTIGRNSIIGAGAVVTRSVPANVIAAGNPAQVVRELDRDRDMQTRADLLANTQRMQGLKNLEKQLLADNSWSEWVRTLLNPKRGD